MDLKPETYQMLLKYGWFSVFSCPGVVATVVVTGRIINNCPFIFPG